MMAADAQKGMAGWNVRDSGELWRSSGRKHQHHHRRHPSPSPKLKDHVITQRGGLSPSKAAAAAQHGTDSKANLRRQHFHGMHSPQQLRGPHVTACGKNPPQRPPRCKPSFCLSNAPTKNLTFEPAMLLPTAEEGKELLSNWKDWKRCNLIHQMKKVKAGAEKSCDQVQDCNSLPKDCSECTNLTEYQSTDCLNKEHNLFFKKDGTDGQCEEKVKIMKEQWAHDVKKQKEAWSAGEKSKREAWMEKKTKEIKETTIIGLEPHIESIHDVYPRINLLPG